MMENHSAYSPLMRIIATIILITFTMLILEPTAVAAQVLHKEHQQATARAAQEEAAKLDQTLETVETTLTALQESLSIELQEPASAKLQGGALADNRLVSVDLSQMQKTVMGLKQQVLNLDQYVEADFETTETHISLQKLPSEIHQRHLDAVTAYRQEMATLLANLDAIIASKDKGQLRQKNEKALKHLKPFKRKKHAPFDPNQLPHHSLKPVKDNKPKTRKQEFLAAGFYDTPTVKLAALGDFQFDKLTGANDPAYLAETVEVQLSPAIMDKAEELQYDPIKIYNFVRNNVNWLPTSGAIQDADLTLSSLQGNATDISSLLITLLRASNIPSRYVHGTIEVPADKFANWVGGFSDIRAAGIHAASGGIPVSSVTSGGVIKHFRMEHIWVEAAIDFFPSRGAINRSADSWVSLDASYKQYDYVSGLDFEQIAPIDQETLVDAVIASGTQNELEGWVTGFEGAILTNAVNERVNVLKQYIQTQSLEPTAIFGGKSIQQLNTPTLPSSIPNRIAVVGARYAEVNENLRHKVTFDFNSLTDNILGDGERVTFSIAELNSQRVTLGFRPATTADEATLNSLLPNAEITDLSQLPQSIPSYLVDVIPELRVNGNLVHSGTPTTMGSEQNFNFSIYTPNFGTKPYSSPVVAGSYLGVVVIGGSLSIKKMEDLKTALEERKSAWEAGEVTNLNRETLLGDLFFSGILSYFSQYYGMASLDAQVSDIVFQLMPSLGTYGSVPKVSYLFGLPRTVTAGGVEMDLDRVASVVTAKDGMTDKEFQFSFRSGLTSSALEHAVPEQMFFKEDPNAEGISAAKALYLANEQEIPIYHIRAENASEIIPQLQLSSEVLNEIQAAIAVGKEVITHKSSITVTGWSGAGYIIFDPETGAGAFKIGGGMNGGYLVATFAGILSALLFVFGVLILGTGMLWILGLFFGVAGIVVLAGVFLVMIGIAYLALSAYLYHLAVEIDSEVANKAVAFGLALAGIIGLLSGLSAYVIAAILAVYALVDTLVALIQELASKLGKLINILRRFAVNKQRYSIRFVAA